MLTGQPATINPPFPYVRMFAADNVGEPSVPPDAEKTGEWYGPTDYQSGFTSLWGVASPAGVESRPPHRQDQGSARIGG